MNRTNSFVSKFLLGWFFEIFIIKKVTGLENFSQKENFILASNHLSHLDWLIGCYICSPRKYTFIGQIDRMEGIAKVLRDWMYAYGETIGVNRNDKESKARAILKAVDFLNRGYDVFLYPEGTRSRDGRIHEFKPGVGRIYLESGKKILPVAMLGTYELMPPGGKLKIKKTVEVIIGKPLEFKELRETALGLGKDSEEYKNKCAVIAKKVEDQVRALLRSKSLNAN